MISHSKKIAFTSCVILLVNSITIIANAQQDNITPPREEKMFDTDRNLLMKDSDSDGVPNLTESLEGTNPSDPEDFLGSEISLPGEDETRVNLRRACLPAYRTIVNSLCINRTPNPATTYAQAQAICRRSAEARVATYEDLTHIYLFDSSDAAYNPLGKWIGNLVADDEALCGNRSITFENDPDRNNFEGTCHKDNLRQYWCVYDRF